MDGQGVVMADFAGDDHVALRRRHAEREASRGADDDDRLLHHPVGRTDYVDAARPCSALQLASQTAQRSRAGYPAHTPDAANGLWLEWVDVEGRFLVRMRSAAFLIITTVLFGYGVWAQATLTHRYVMIILAGSVLLPIVHTIVLRASWKRCLVAVIGIPALGFGLWLFLLGKEFAAEYDGADMGVWGLVSDGVAWQFTYLLFMFGASGRLTTWEIGKVPGKVPGTLFCHDSYFVSASESV